MMTTPYFSTSSIRAGLVLVSASLAACPASAGGLLGVAGGATAAVSGAVGIGGGGVPVGGLTGARSGSGVLGATLGSGGFQPGFASGAVSRLTAAGAPDGRAWGTFDDARGALRGRGALAQRVGGLPATTLPAGALASGEGSGKARGLKSMTDGFVLSRNFALPAPGPLSAGAPASAKASARASGSGSGGRARVAGSAQVLAGR